MIDISELKKIIEKEKAVFGLNETLKLMKKKQVEKVWIASNCPEEVSAKLDGAENSEKTNQELGALCKKPFNVSVLGVKK